MGNKSLFLRLAALILGIILLAVWATISAMHYSVREEFTEVSEAAISKNVASANALAELARELGNAEQPIGEVAREFAERRDDSPDFILLDNNLEPLFASNILFENVKAEFDPRGLLSINASGGSEEQTRLELVTDRFQQIRRPDGEIVAYLVAVPPPPSAVDGAAFAKGAWMRVMLWLALIVIAGMALAAIVLRWAVRPIDQLTEAALMLNGGEMPAKLESPHVSELKELFSAFNLATATLGRTAELRKQMIADVAHELRTPITNLRSQVEAFEAGLIENRDGLAATLTSELSLLERLIDDFQQLALSESGQLRIASVELDLAEFASTIVSTASEKSGFKVTDNLSAPIIIMGDPDRIQQVLLNLIENALRHRREGLVIRLDPIADGAHRGLRFSDNGPGIAEGANERIFDRFYRGEISREQDRAGAGLGLTIARSLMQAMGGSIIAAPRAQDGPTGARFELVFRPIEEVA